MAPPEPSREQQIQSFSIISVIFSLPPNELVLWTLIGLAVVLGLYWQLSAKKGFGGVRARAS